MDDKHLKLKPDLKDIYDKVMGNNVVDQDVKSADKSQKSKPENPPVQVKPQPPGQTVPTPAPKTEAAPLRSFTPPSTPPTANGVVASAPPKIQQPTPTVPPTVPLMQDQAPTPAPVSQAFIPQNQPAQAPVVPPQIPQVPPVQQPVQPFVQQPAYPPQYNAALAPQVSPTVNGSPPQTPIRTVFRCKTMPNLHLFRRPSRVFGEALKQYLPSLPLQNNDYPCAPWIQPLLNRTPYYIKMTASPLPLLRQTLLKQKELWFQTPLQ
jgi:hypothetical protein